MNEDIKYRIGFSIIPGIGRVKITQLENYFGNLENAWQAEPAELKKAGLESGAINDIARWRPRGTYRSSRTSGVPVRS